MDKLYPKAVIFDLGSTLIEYESLAWTELMIQCSLNVKHFLHNEGYGVPNDEEFLNIFGEIQDMYRQLASEKLVEWTVPQAMKKLFEKLEIQSDNGLIGKAFEAYYKPVHERLFIYDDTLATLEKIKQKGYIIGLISNTIFPEEIHQKELKQFSIKPFLDFTVFSSTFGVRKPHRDIFYKAANLAGVAPSECVYIGDRYYEDYEGPTQIGMSAILKIVSIREYPTDMPPSIRSIENLKELERYFDF